MGKLIKIYLTKLFTQLYAEFFCNIMRIDKFLKISRLIKRRTVSKSACESGRILINGKEAKPGSKVQVGDKITISFGGRTQTVEILELKEHVTKDQASELYKILND